MRLVALLLIVSLAGCLDGDDPMPVEEPEAPVRVLTEAPFTS